MQLAQRLAQGKAAQPGGQHSNRVNPSLSCTTRTVIAHAQGRDLTLPAEEYATRRGLLVAGGLLLGSVSGSLPAQADEAQGAEGVITSPEAVESAVTSPAVSSSPSTPTPASTSSRATGQVVYLDVKLEGKPLGRISIELFEDVGTGAQRFKDLVVGKQGVGYRLSRFDGIFDTYLRCEGVKSLSYSATYESPIAGGDSLEQLEVDLQQQTRRHDTAGLVSLIVGEAEERPTKEKLVAKNGKLVTITQQAGEAPNGTTFTITRAADPELDTTNLIVGRVVGGMDVVEAIGGLPFARPRDSYYDQPFFQVAKAMGDKRADTAEKGFNRPFKRVIVSGTGLL